MWFCFAYQRPVEIDPKSAETGATLSLSTATIDMELEQNAAKDPNATDGGGGQLLATTVSDTEQTILQEKLVM